MPETTELKVAELEGAALDWAVAKATGASDLTVTASRSVCCIYEMPCGNGCWTAYYQPSTDWNYAGPLIARYRVSLIYSFEEYEALIGMTHSQSSESPLVAACQCIVAHLLGDSVSIPAELAPLNPA
jgi:hypothetical protein